MPDTFPAGLGEPLNAILLASSDPLVLVDQQTDGGFRNYFLCAHSLLWYSLSLISHHSSVGFGSECLGQHDGSNQGANLGDGNGLRAYHHVACWWPT